MTHSTTNRRLIGNPSYNAPNGINPYIRAGFDLGIFLNGLAPGTVGVAYSGSVAATGGTAPYTYAFTSGSLAGTGLSLDTSTGAVTGTPISPGGTFNFDIRATATGGAIGTRSYSLVISATGVITLDALGGGTVGIGYSDSAVASGGTGPYSYTVTTGVGTLPPGLSLNGTTGLLAGTPTAAGAYNFDIRAIDSASALGTRSYTVVIAPASALPTIVATPGVLALGGKPASLLYSALPSTLTVHLRYRKKGP